jgi:hypothetical protein
MAPRHSYSGLGISLIAWAAQKTQGVLHASSLAPQQED